MKLSVTQNFYDSKNNNIYRKIGDIVEYPEERAKEIETRGFGKIIDPKPTRTPRTERENEPRRRDSDEPKRERRRN